MKNIFVALMSLFFVIDASASISVIITSPVDKTFAATTQISLSASASTSTGAITSVAYYVGSSPTPIATVTAAPYPFVWNNVAPGTYTLTAKATDSFGHTKTSVAKNITVFSYVGKLKADSTNFTVPTAVSKTYGNISQLPGDTLTCANGTVVYVKGFASAGDGGQGWLYGDSTKASQPDGVIFINSTNCGFKRLHSNDLNIKLGGAKGDGINDDTVVIQKVLDTKFNVIGNAATDTYLVSATNKVSTAGYKAALVLYSGQKLDLKGSTIKLANGANSSVLMNDALYSRTNATLTGAAAPPTFPIDCTDDGINDGIDDCVVIRNGTIDGNVANQKISGLGDGSGYAFAPTVYLGNLKRSALVDVTVKNFYGAGIYFGGPNAKNIVTDISSNNIIVRDGLGTGVALNGTRIKSNSIDIAGAQSFTENGTPVQPWAITPNSITLTTNDSDYGTIRADNCGWGFKLQDGSINNHFTKIWVSGTGFGAQAVKFQGKYDANSSANTAYNQDTRIDEIISENNQWNGLYVVNQKGLQVTSYTGNNNGLGWAPGYTDLYNYRDIEIVRSSLNITTANINSPTVGVLDSRTPFPAGDSTPNDRIFGTMNISNPQHTSADHLFDIRAGNNTINKLSITASSPLVTYIAYEYGALAMGQDTDLNSYFGVKTLVSNQPIAAADGLSFQVPDPGSNPDHPYVHVDCMQLGTNASWLQANNTTTGSPQVVCPL